MILLQFVAFLAACVSCARSPHTARHTCCCAHMLWCVLPRTLPSPCSLCVCFLYAPMHAPLHTPSFCACFLAYFKLPGTLPCTIHAYLGACFHACFQLLCTLCAPSMHTPVHDPMPTPHVYHIRLALPSFTISEIKSSKITSFPPSLQELCLSCSWLYQFS